MVVLSSVMSFLGVCKGDDAGKATEEHFSSAPCMRRCHFVLIPAGQMQFGKLGLTPDSRLVHSPLHFNSLLLLSSTGS